MEGNIESKKEGDKEKKKKKVATVREAKKE